MNNTSIEWTDHTWNPWRGCTRVERAMDCVNCYAATLGHRFGIEWGPNGIRVESRDATWREPFRWAKKPCVCDACGASYASEVSNALPCPCGCTTGHRARVFALSMGDWLEDEPVRWEMETGCEKSFPVGGIPAEWLARMLDTIRQTPQLNYILLTKRPQNFERRIYDVGNSLLVPSGMRANNEKDAPLLNWLKEWVEGTPPANVCVMTSVGYQEAAPRISELLRIPARWHGLSLEPLLESVDLTRVRWSTSPDHHGNPQPDHFENVLVGGGPAGVPKIDWVIPGGETGPGARQCVVSWIGRVINQCRQYHCPVFVKQLGSEPCQDLTDVIPEASDEETQEDPVSAAQWDIHRSWMPIWLKHTKGGDPAEWPEDLRVRQFPEGL